MASAERRSRPIQAEEPELGGGCADIGVMRGYDHIAGGSGIGSKAEKTIDALDVTDPVRWQQELPPCHDLIAVNQGDLEKDRVATSIVVGKEIVDEQPRRTGEVRNV